MLPVRKTLLLLPAPCVYWYMYIDIEKCKYIYVYIICPAGMKDSTSFAGAL